MNEDLLQNYNLAINNRSSKTKISRHLPGSDSFFIAKVAKSLKKPLLVIVNDAYNANRIYDELSFFLLNSQVSIFSDTEVLPYERVAPQRDIVAHRIKTLWQMLLKQLDVIIVSVNALQYKVCPPSYISSKVLFLKILDRLSIEELRKRLISSDYALVDKVYEAGEFAIRGGIIDIIPMGYKDLIRIELFNDEIESLKIIDVKTNVLKSSTDKIEILPTREYPIDTDSIKRFEQSFGERFSEGKYTDYRKDIKKGILRAGSEFYLPLFFNNYVSTLFDYIDDSWEVIYFNDITKELNQNWQEIDRRYELFSYQYPCLKPVELFIPTNGIYEHLKQLSCFEIRVDTELEKQVKAIPDIVVDNRNADPFYKLKDFLNKFKGEIYLVVDSLGRCEVLKETLSRHDITFIKYANLKVIQAFIYNGFICNSIAFITEYELFKKEEKFSAHYLMRRRNITDKDSSFDKATALRDLSDIQVGDYVVHINHGIGKYLGLTSQKIDDITYDMLELEYQHEAKLFIPINNLHLISKYTSINNDKLVELTLLGSSSWDRVKNKVEKKINDMAAELLELYAKREMESGNRFIVPIEYSEFANQFGYEPTADQESSFSAVIEDLTSKKPMDRLICGDVGFGKTEIAMRAAFICAMNGRQIAVLTPTTLLTEQHYQNFVNRFAGFPIKIAEVSRFKTKGEIADTLLLLKNGQIDIIIGTHRLIQPDIKFKNLGLVIIDEEHRFGVRQKEKLKQLRVNVDILAMTATPIPRSLSMALDGIRDFSIIATPPKRRLSVNTIICNEERELIKEGVLREIRRGGQIFFLYNNVETIISMYDKLVEIVPNLQIAIAHGQMQANQLEQTIKDFIHQKYDLLLCSTIIENGIDIPNVNTIFIYQADKLGLAQLHQLRGRVGRSYHQAYCYMIIPDNISQEASKRIEAIQMTTELGSGFNLALHDLEIRGAGEVLGNKQSGDIREVGLSLYTQLLKQAVKKFKYDSQNSVSQRLDEFSCEVDLNTTSILPNNYCSNVHERLVYYKRLAKASTVDEVDEAYQEIINTYGAAPIEVKALVNIHYLRIKAVNLGIENLDVRNKAVHICFIDRPKVDPNRIISLLQELKTCKMVGGNKLVWNVELSSIEEKIKKANFILDYLCHE